MASPRNGPRPGHIVLLPAVVAAFVACHVLDEASAVPTPASICGNGIVETGEACDDGNVDNSDGCLMTCQAPVVWTTSDPHVHSTGCSRHADPAELARELRRQQIQVGAGLVWGVGYEHDALFFTGRDDPVSTASFILHYDLEISHFAAAKMGHLVLLGLDSLAFSRDVFDAPNSGVPVVDWARRQPRSVVGMAHAQFWPADGSFPVPPGGCCTPWEVVVHAARGRLDFLSMERTFAKGPGTFRLWKAMQNAGFRIAIAGASDWSCVSERLDETTPRTDALLDGPLSYESWLLALEAGRTTAAIGVGNHLNLRVDGRRLGEQLELAGPQEVTVTIENQGRASDVEILVNGNVATRLPVAAGAQVAQARIPVTTSSWIVARSAYVLTSPVYVLVAGRPVRPSPDDACYLWRSVEHLTQLVMSGRLYLYDTEAEALEAYREANGELQRRFVESGGGSCR